MAIGSSIRRPLIGWRGRVFFGKEVGVGAFYGSGRLQGLPNRAIRTKQFLYIRNYDVDRMPGYNAVQG